MSHHWVRFRHGETVRFGRLEGARVRAFEGDMFAGTRPTDLVLPLADVTLLTPVQPTKVIALWNNFHALGQKLGLAVPTEPLYLIKSPNSYLAPGGTIHKPPCDGKVVYEGELGIVIGKT